MCRSGPVYRDSTEPCIWNPFLLFCFLFKNYKSDTSGKKRRKKKHGHFNNSREIIRADVEDFFSSSDQPLQGRCVKVMERTTRPPKGSIPVTGAWTNSNITSTGKCEVTIIMNFLQFDLPVCLLYLRYYINMLLNALDGLSQTFYLLY